MWLFVVLILNSSYTAGLSSMLTVRRLQPNVTDIEWLKTNSLKVGCDGDSFVRNYLQKVLGFKQENIDNVSSEYSYEGEFDSANISAAFLELPYVSLKECLGKNSCSSKLEVSNPEDTPESLHSSSPAEIEVVNIPDSDTQKSSNVV
ncbi:hypothetical protein POTOM_015159 [Populus tomentosa]|uniref:Ionotropic glutamate receptor C-terminal domain-containing protein n=1 Tax=Populus tomentosa TaxID=118781 RepID=A0A8X8A1B1_POPTO|nr:hypothetical protein POTOM_015159 [Populus tomentosa]